MKKILVLAGLFLIFFFSIKAIDSNYKVSEHLKNDQKNYFDSLVIEKLGWNYQLNVGSDDKTLDKGAGIITKFDRPGDGVGSLTIVAGHRMGWGSPLFFKLPDIQKDDVVTVNFGKKTYKYSVISKKILEVKNLGQIVRDSNKELLGLITCHPYPTSLQRYFVLAQRIN